MARSSASISASTTTCAPWALVSPAIVSREGCDERNTDTVAYDGPTARRRSRRSACSPCPANRPSAHHTLLIDTTCSRFTLSTPRIHFRRLLLRCRCRCRRPAATAAVACMPQRRLLRAPLLVLLPHFPSLEKLLLPDGHRGLEFVNGPCAGLQGSRECKAAGSGAEARKQGRVERPAGLPAPPPACARSPAATPAPPSRSAQHTSSASLRCADETAMMTEASPT